MPGCTTETIKHQNLVSNKINKQYETVMQKCILLSELKA